MEENANNKIIDATAQSIIDYGLDSMVDISEIALDTLLEESILKEIPIVKTVVNLSKIGFAIREKHMLKKTLMFINKLNSNGVASIEYVKYKSKLKNKDKILYKELENILIIIDRIIEENKSIILANLFYNYILKNITWEEFQELSVIVDNIFINDLPELVNIYEKRDLTMNDIINQISFNRLKTQNLVMDFKSTVRGENGNISFFYSEKDYVITSLGIKLYEYGIKNIDNM